jgi:molybdopterin converting factor small subunit
MSVKIEVPLFVRHLTGDTTEIQVNGRTVRECLDLFVEQFPATKRLIFDSQNKLLGYITLYINGANAFPEEMDRPVKSGDLISMLYIIIGG